MFHQPNEQQICDDLSSKDDKQSKSPKKQKFPYKIRIDNLDDSLDESKSLSSFYSLSQSDSCSVKPTTPAICHECKRQRKKATTPEVPNEQKNLGQQVFVFGNNSNTRLNASYSILEVSEQEEQDGLSLQNLNIQEEIDSNTLNAPTTPTEMLQIKMPSDTNSLLVNPGSSTPNGNHELIDFEILKLNYYSSPYCFEFLFLLFLKQVLMKIILLKLTLNAFYFIRIKLAQFQATRHLSYFV